MGWVTGGGPAPVRDKSIGLCYLTYSGGRDWPNRSHIMVRGQSVEAVTVATAAHKRGDITMYPENLRYTKDPMGADRGRYWDHDHLHAQKELGDMSTSIFPRRAPGRQGKTIGSQVGKGRQPPLSPVSGEVTEVNELLHTAPENFNEDPYGSAWLIRSGCGCPSKRRSCSPRPITKNTWKRSKVIALPAASGADLPVAVGLLAGFRAAFARRLIP